MPDPLGLGTKYLAMLASSNQHRIVKVDVHSPDGQYITTIPNVSAGSVSVDTTAKVRRTCSITIEDQGLIANIGQSMVPYFTLEPGNNDADSVPPAGNNWGTLLHPLSQNELYIYRGFQYADGTQDLIPLGIFRMSNPQIVDSGNAITITIKGNDRSAAITRYKWTAPYQIQAGTLLEVAVVNVLKNRWPSIPLDYSLIGTTMGTVNTDGSYNATGIQLSTTTFGADLAGSNDPWADLMGLVTSVGFELYFDTSGRPVMKAIPNPIGILPSFAGIYQEGVTCQMNQLTMALDETTTYSGVIAIGNGTGNSLAPVTSLSVIGGVSYIGVWNTNPDSPTYYDPSSPGSSLIGEVPFILSTQTIPGPNDSQLSAQIKINSMAYYELQRILTAYLSPDIDAVCNPALWEEDVIQITRMRVGLDSSFMVQKIEIPLDVSSTSKITLKPQASPDADGGY